MSELLFSTLAMMFFILATKRARLSFVSFSNLRNGDWTGLKRPLVYSLLAGIALAFYLLSWRSGLVFIFILFVAVSIQFIIDHLKGRPTGYLGIAFIPAFLIALVIRALPIWSGYQKEDLQVPSLVIGILAFVAYSLLSYGMVSRDVKRYYYPLSLAIAGGIGVGIFHLIDSSVLNSMWDKFDAFTPSGGLLTIAEAKGISLTQVWDWFSTDLYLSFISLAILLYIIVKEGALEKTLLFVWCIVFLVATIGQNRNAYYLAVSVAILTAYFAWILLEFARFISVKFAPRSEKKKAPTKGTTKEQSGQAAADTGEQEIPAIEYGGYRHAVYAGVTLVVIFFLAFFPNFEHMVDQANTTTGPSDDWHESLLWMRDNTPDPFQDPDFFYARYEKPEAGESVYPESAYGVMSAFEYGYWITYMAHRIPNGTPGLVNTSTVGQFLTAQSETEAAGILDKLGSKYVVLDYLMMIPQRFYAMPIWAGKDVDDFFDVYRVQTQPGEIQPVMLINPDYYRSMGCRLYNFGGQAWNPDDWIKENPDWKMVVISYVEATDADGTRYRGITDIKNFGSYGEAKEFVDANPGYIIVGNDPFVSPIPLEKLDHFELIHKSPSIVGTRVGETIALVETFEYHP